MFIQKIKIHWGNSKKAIAQAQNESKSRRITICHNEAILLVARMQLAQNRFRRKTDSSRLIHRAKLDRITKNKSLKPKQDTTQAVRTSG
jgi:hypothetical protein